MKVTNDGEKDRPVVNNDGMCRLLLLSCESFVQLRGFVMMMMQMLMSEQSNPAVANYPIYPLHTGKKKRLKAEFGHVSIRFEVKLFYKYFYGQQQYISKAKNEI